jgi:hypothetical protein
MALGVFIDQKPIRAAPALKSPYESNYPHYWRAPEQSQES